MSWPGAGYAPENPSGSRCLLDSNSTRTESYVAIHHGQSVSSRVGAPKAPHQNGWQQITRPNREPEEGLKTLRLVMLQNCQPERARGKLSAIPISPGHSQVPSHPIPARWDHQGPEEMKLGNQTRSTWKVRRGDFGDCGAPATDLRSSGPWLRPDGNAFHLEGKLVAHYHADPLGATTR